MIISVWRYSHLALAVSSFLLLLLASVTGIVLAFDPLTDKAATHRVQDPSTVRLSEAVPLLKEKYGDVHELRMEKGALVLHWTDEAGNGEKSYVDARNGKELGAVEEQSSFFQWVTALHRSLFLHETGRLLMGITCFLLMLIVISGIILVVQRQKGILRFFARVGHESGAQYFHVVFGRIALFPILLIAFTGAYLSATGFGWIRAETPSVEVDFAAIKAEPELDWNSFTVFKNHSLADLQTLEFPFSEDVEDYFTVKFHDSTIAINQVTGELLAKAEHSSAAKLNAWSLDWHTGRSGAVWAIILAISCGYILFFIGSGFLITFRRRANKKKNKFRADECTTVILVGSENGSTLRCAVSVSKQLSAKGEKVWLTDMNNYKVFPAMQQLIVFTSTHGLGDPPSNAGKFLSRLPKMPQPQHVNFTVLAFGSRSYDDFCRFGLEVDAALRKQEWAQPIMDVHTVNDRSPEDYATWCKLYTAVSGQFIEPDAKLFPAHHLHLPSFTVVQKSDATEPDYAFEITLLPKKKMKVRSGDLLAIYPANDHRERLYSIGMLGDAIHLSLKLHPEGLGSTFLHQLQVEDTLKARIVENRHFHFPGGKNPVIMISNGTGIAPFLGMIGENKKGRIVHLYTGFRYRYSLDRYRELLSGYEAGGRLSGLHEAYSREASRMYVTDILARDTEEITELLRAGAVVMLCGSLAMQKDVCALLSNICREKGLGDILLEKGRLLTDCY
ncbi:PepSY domain-containing protein [Parasegetibacter sp. NRK P23]|uniref:PepSY domain-containing protein n=1 Tax=Parasegetibacter sp. NRK P23 TaxID=2942999 RepID=UPI002042F9D9|nr:PepSY domain-containing protein [Parasegetibacter sp. NRK P23]MCM5529636.1 PepSY domain-containing protein [Parasegetibacter sp. NRK P23]